MARRKRKKRKKRGSGTLLTVAVCAIVFSIGIRFFAGGRSHAVGEPQCQIEVLNGTGKSGLAMEMAVILRRMGIDVLIVGDAEHYGYEQSLLIDRKGNPGLMKKLSHLTGCRRILTQTQERPLIDATLIIGGDIEELGMGGGH